MQTVSEYITSVIDQSHLTQKDIANLVGWPKPNFISMLKRGEARLPLSKVKPFAHAMGLDARELMIRCLREYQPDVLEALGLLPGGVSGIE